MRFSDLDSRSRNVSRVALIAFAVAAAGGCSSDTGRFGGDEPVYTGSTPNQRAILGQSRPVDRQDGWRNVDTTGSIPQQAPQPVVQQTLPPPAPVYAAAPQQPVYAPPPPVESNQAFQPSQPAAPPPRVVQPTVVAQAPRPAAAGWTGVGGSTVTAQSGDTVESLSRRYGVPANAIAQVNGLPAQGPVHPGQRVLIPVYSAAPSAAAAPAAAPASIAAAPQPAPRQIPITRPVAAAAPQAPEPVPTPIPAPPRAVAAAPQAQPGGVKLVGDYTVRKGDTLASIARTYGVSEQALKERNGLRSSMLQQGQHLVLPAGTRLMLKTSQAPATASAPEAPIPAPVKQVAQAPIAAPGRPVAQVPAPAPVRTAAAAPAPAPVAPPVKAAAAAPAKPAPTPSSTAKIDQRAAETIAVAKEPAVEEPTGSVAAGSFRWPVRGRVISEFGSKPNGEKNEGINLAVPEGTSVKAADDGEVIYAGNELKGYGNLVLVRHRNGYVTAYAHASEVLVNRGDKIARGQIIARAGATGSVSQPQLHFELRKGQKAIDPKPYLASN